MLKIRRIAVVLTLLCALPVSANWDGYLNTQSLPGVKYGYLAINGFTKASGKLRLVCLSDNTFKILFEKSIVEQTDSMQIEVSVDSLPTMSFKLSRLGDDFGVGDQDSEFWKLVAQMVAGGSITIGAMYQYSLAGFTKTYVQTCGEFELSDQYREFLHLYR